MGTAPVITIFVRHSADCKYSGEEFEKRCRCRKHFRWTKDGKQYRRKAGTRSWEEAEQLKRELQDHLAGRVPENKSDEARGLEECITVFIQDKRVKGVSQDQVGKYTLELSRLRQYCERNGVYTVQGITRELLTAYCATWEDLYPSSHTRSNARAHIRPFLRYCYEAQWISRVPPMPVIRIDEPETLPLSADEYKRLLAAIPKTFQHARGPLANGANRDMMQKKVRALIQLMRFSGLAIRDAVTLKRSDMLRDKSKRVYRVVTARQKTGTHVSVPLLPDVSKELMAVKNDNPAYFFWNGVTKPEHAARGWTNRFIVPLFNEAKIPTGHMKSHRLRDTFAVELLQKGVPLEEVSKLLGHTSIKTTEKSYARWVKGRQDRLDGLVMAAWSSK